MAIWRNSPSMPNVRVSSATIGTIREPRFLSRNSVPSTRTKAIVVEISRPLPVAFSCASNASSAGTLSDTVD